MISLLIAFAVLVISYLVYSRFTQKVFAIYVISGTERTTTRAIVVNSPIKDYVTPDHVIGTDFEVKVKGHEEESSDMNFKYENGDELVLTGGFIQKNLKCGFWRFAPFYHGEKVARSTKIVWERVTVDIYIY